MTAARETEQTSVVLKFQPAIDITDDQFFDLCQLNRSYRIERTASGEIVIMSPTGSETGNRNFNLIGQLGIWADRDGTGLGFDSSTTSRRPQSQPPVRDFS